MFSRLVHTLLYVHNFYKLQWAASNQNQLSENKVVKTIQKKMQILRNFIGNQLEFKRINQIFLCVFLIDIVTFVTYMTSVLA